MDDPGHAPTDRRPACRLHAHQLGRRVGEAGEDAYGVRSTTHAGHHHVRRAPQQCLALLPGLTTKHLLEGSHHPWIGVGSHHRTEAVVRLLHRGDPVAHGLVHRVLQGPAAGHGRPDLGPQQPHAKYVQLLALHVHLAHVDAALHAQQGGRRRRGHAVLSGTGLGQEPGLAHPPGQERLSEHVVDLVGTRVVQVLALQEQPAAQLFGEIVAFGHWGRPAGVVGQQPVQVGPIGRVGPGLQEGLLEFQHRGDQRLRDEATTEVAEPAVGRRIGQAHGRGPPLWLVVLLTATPPPASRRVDAPHRPRSGRVVPPSRW